MAKSKARKSVKTARRVVKKTTARKATGAGKTARRAAKPTRRAGNARKAAKPARSTKPVRKLAKKAKPAVRATARKRAAATKTVRPAPKVATRSAAKAAPRPAPKKAAAPARGTAPVRRPPTLDRARRTIAEAETHGVPSSLNLDRSASAARSGRAEMNQKLHEHTSSSPALTAGDVDADWESAETVGDEAPGGDNPTPDQDVVEEIGKALGVEYDDDEELQGGDEIVERDRKRWELDPASSDDFDDRD
jgi:hypothetical protein